MGQKKPLTDVVRSIKGCRLRLWERGCSCKEEDGFPFPGRNQSRKTAVPGRFFVRGWLRAPCERYSARWHPRIRRMVLLVFVAVRLSFGESH